MLSKKLPRVFIGCSKESIEIAKALQNNLWNVSSPERWDQDIFQLNETTIEGLLRIAPTYDFAVFIFSGEDITRSRGVRKPAPRDNVVFETGLFMGVLERERVFIVKPDNLDLKLPSDLWGITLAEYRKLKNITWSVALSRASNLIEQAIRQRKFHKRNKAANARTENKLKDAAQYFNKILINRYGVSTAVNSMSLTITDMKGSAVIRRGMQGIKVISKGGVKFERIPGLLAPGHPRGRIISYPAFTQSVGFRKQVALRYRVKSPKRCLFDVVIKDALTEFDPKLSYEYAAKVSRFCAMTREEFTQVYQETEFPFEYFALRIEMPTHKTVLELSFPDGYTPKVDPGVFFGESDLLHEAELARVSRGFRRTKNGARFVINKPLIGFNYIIYWDPPRGNGRRKRR